MKLPADGVRVPVDFITKPQIIIRDSFQESHNNDGSISNTVDIRLSNVVLDRRATLDDMITAHNLPSGLRATFSFVSDHVVQVGLNGRASKHTPQDGISNLSFSFRTRAI